MAEFFKWDAGQLGLEIPQMDAEHVRLIEIMNRVYAEYERSRSSPKLKPAVKELVDYTIEHFRHEEAYMTRLNYPEVNKHKLIHATLIEKLKSHVSDFEKSAQMNTEFFSFLKFWLQSHLMVVDKEYAAFGKKLKPPAAR
jgi:hemerythrin